MTEEIGLSDSAKLDEVRDHLFDMEDHLKANAQVLPSLRHAEPSATLTHQWSSIGIIRLPNQLSVPQFGDGLIDDLIGRSQRRKIHFT